MSCDYPEISSFIDEFVQVFDGWSNSIEQKAKEFGNNRSMYLKEVQSKLKDLNQSNEELNHEMSRIQTEHDKENQEITELTKSLEGLKLVEKKLPEQVKQSKNEHDKLYSQLESIMNDLSESYLERANKLAKLQKVSHLYQNCLGLEFKSIPNALQCNFTLIDSIHPDRVFSFLLKLSSSNEYQISDVQPELPESDINQIIKMTNINNDLGSLMKQMRKLFKQSLSK